MIKCEHLVKKYMSTTAVSDLSLDIISGTFMLYSVRTEAVNPPL